LTQSRLYVAGTLLEMKWYNDWSITGLLDGEFSRATTGYASKGTLRYAW
jgi:hypothetical protein